MSRRPLVRPRAGVEIGGMRPDIVPGAVFPDYELPDHRGKHRTLSELQGGDPLVLVLSRGGFCPRDRRQHEGLLQLHREMEVGQTRGGRLHEGDGSWGYLTYDLQVRMRA